MESAAWYALVEQEASLAATPHQRFEKSAPNEMWQADFKGHFAMKNGHRCHPLNIIDDHSRFNLCIEALEGETFEQVKPTLERIFREYGLPFRTLNQQKLILKMAQLFAK